MKTTFKKLLVALVMLSSVVATTTSPASAAVAGPATCTYSYDADTTTTTLTWEAVTTASSYNIFTTPAAGGNATVLFNGDVLTLPVDGEIDSAVTTYTVGAAFTSSPVSVETPCTEAVVPPDPVGPGTCEYTWEGYYTSVKWSAVEDATTYTLLQTLEDDDEATVYYGPTTETEFPFYFGPVGDNELSVTVTVDGFVTEATPCTEAAAGTTPVAPNTLVCNLTLDSAGNLDIRWNPSYIADEFDASQKRFADYYEVYESKNGSEPELVPDYFGSDRTYGTTDASATDGYFILPIWFDREFYTPVTGTKVPCKAIVVVDPVDPVDPVVTPFNKCIGKTANVTLTNEKEASVYRLYCAVLQRQPELDGFTYWKNLPVSLYVISNEFAITPEFINQYGRLTNKEFVAVLYKNILDRDGDGEGATYWIGLLDGGLTRGDLIVFFSDSPEFRNLTVK